MMFFALFSTLLTAEASPTKGIRLGLCAGAASNCQVVQARLSYNHDQFGITLGAGLLSLSLTGQYYLSSVDSTMRHFLSASWSPLAYPGLNLGFDASYELTMMSGYGLSYGADIHLLENRWLVLTPRIGLDVNNAADGDGTNQSMQVSPSLSTEVSLAF
jgi:hypothetical protein